MTLPSTSNLGEPESISVQIASTAAPTQHAAANTLSSRVDFSRDTVMTRGSIMQHDMTLRRDYRSVLRRRGLTEWEAGFIMTCFSGRPPEMGPT